MNVFQVLYKRKLHILLVFGLTVGTVGLGTLLAKPAYETSAKLLIRVSRENIYVPTLAGSNTVIKIDREAQINTEIQILNSRFVAEAVAVSLGPTVIYPDLNRPTPAGVGEVSHPTSPQPSILQTAAERLQKNLTLEAVRLSDVIKVKFKHEDPKMAATVLNTLVNVYLEHHLEVYKTPHSHEFFRDQVQIMKTKLSQAEEDLRAFKTQHHLTSLDEQRKLLLKNEADILATLGHTQSQEAEVESRLQQLRTQIDTTPKTLGLGGESEHNLMNINSIRQKLSELELHESNLRMQYTEQHPLVQNVRQQIRLVRQDLNQQEAKRYTKVRVEVNPLHQTLQQAYLQSQAELKALRAKKATLTAQLADYQYKLQTFSQLESEFNILQQEVEFKRQNYQLYLTKLEESRISDAMDKEKITGVSMIEPARPPVTPASPNKRLNLAVAAFLGSFGGLGLAFFLEYLTGSQSREETLVPDSPLPALAAMPE
jgi:uncharacterized protein involved in exopolysaccharide biosynthesis